MPASAGRGVSRFIVMATLQAARARRLGLPLESAYSWGLNRAIFYAAAKRGFGSSSGERAPGEPPHHVESTRLAYSLGDDFAYRDTRLPGLFFTIGDQTQTEADFERQIVARFGDQTNFERAWREAEVIVASADLATLRSARAFYAEVYKPRRDALRAAWTDLVRVDRPSPSPPAASRGSASRGKRKRHAVDQKGSPLA